MMPLRFSWGLGGLHRGQLVRPTVSLQWILIAVGRKLRLLGILLTSFTMAPVNIPHLPNFCPLTTRDSCQVTPRPSPVLLPSQIDFPTLHPSIPHLYSREGLPVQETLQPLGWALCVSQGKWVLGISLSGSSRGLRTSLICSGPIFWPACAMADGAW